MIAINSLTKAVIGLFGFTIQVDVTALLIHKIKSVQIGTTDLTNGNFPEPVTNEVTLDVLQSYLNNPNAPRLAFNCSDGEINIFCKNAAGVSDHAVSTRYRIGDYVNHVIGSTAVEAIWKCITEGVSDSELSTAWAITGHTETTGVEWEFVDYLPITDTINYGATTFLELFGYRNSQQCYNESDNLDAPNKDITLVLNYALAAFWNIRKQHIPIKVQNIIDQEELRIINE